jgi:hypothetical protein
MPLPDWLAAELARTGHLQSYPPRSDGSTPVLARARNAVLAAGGGCRTGEAALATLLAPVLECGAVAEGAGFSDKLNRAAYTTGGLVAAGHLVERDAKAALMAAAGQVRPGQDRRALQIILSGMDAGRRRPLRLGDRR